MPKWARGRSRKEKHRGGVPDSLKVQRFQSQSCSSTEVLLLTMSKSCYFHSWTNGVSSQTVIAEIYGYVFCGATIWQSTTVFPCFFPPISLCSEFQKISWPISTTNCDSTIFFSTILGQATFWLVVLGFGVGFFFPNCSWKPSNLTSYPISSPATLLGRLKEPKVSPSYILHISPYVDWSSTTQFFIT